MTTVSEISAAIYTLNVFQIQELDKLIKARMSTFGLPDRSAAPTVPYTPVPYSLDSARSKFKVGDIVEFYSKRDYKNIQVRVEKVNAVNLSCRRIDAPFTKWRVAPSFCRLVGADKVPAAPATPDVAFPRSPTLGAASTAAGAGAW